MYSGHELVKAWGADLIPVGAGFAGDLGGVLLLVLRGLLLLVLLEQHLAIALKMKFNLI